MYINHALNLTTRQIYERSYRQMRAIGIQTVAKMASDDVLTPVARLAFYSFEKASTEPTGWVNAERGLVWFDLMIERRPDIIFPL